LLLLAFAAQEDILYVLLFIAQYGENDNKYRLAPGMPVVSIELGAGLEVTELKDPVNITMSSPPPNPAILKSKIIISFANGKCKFMHSIYHSLVIESITLC
jgi:hypothetical protein